MLLTVVSLTHVVDSPQSDPCCQWSVWPVLLTMLSLTSVMDSGQSDQCYGQWSVWPVLLTVLSLTRVMDSGPSDSCYCCTRGSSEEENLLPRRSVSRPSSTSPPAPLLSPFSPSAMPSTGGPWVSWQRPLLSPSHSPFHGWTMGELTETITQCIPLSLPREDHGWVDRDHYSVHPTLPSTGGPWVSWQRPLLSASHSLFHGWTMGELTETITQCIPLSLPRVDHGWIDRDHYSVHPTLPSTGGPWVSWQRPLLSASHSPFHGWTMGELTETITQCIPLSLPRVDHGWVDRDHYSVHPTLPSTGGPWVNWQRPLLSASHSPFHGWTMGELTETITQCIPLSLPRVDHGWIDRDHYSVHPTLPSTGGPWVSWQRPLLSASHSPFHGRTMGELTETITQSIPLSLPRVDHGWVDRDHYSVHPTLPSTGGPWVSWQRPLLNPSHSPFHGRTMGELTETITQSIPLSLPRVDHGWVDRDHYSVHPPLPSTGGPWVSWQRPLLNPSHSPFHGWTMGELTETITQSIPLSLPREDHGWVDRDHYSVHPTLPSTGGPWVSWQRPLLSPSHSPFHGWTMGELTETITQSIPLSLPREDHGWVDRDHYSVHPTLPSTGEPWVSWQRPLLSPSHSPFHGRTMGELTETITQSIPLSLPRVDHGWVDRDHYSVHPTLPSMGGPWVSWQRPLLSPSHSPFHGRTMGELTETITQSIPLSLPREDHGWVDRDHYSVHPTLPSTGGPWVSWQRPLLSPSHSPFHGRTMGELTETITQSIPLSLPRVDHGWVDRDHYSVHPTLPSTGGPWVSWQRPLLCPSHSPFHGRTMGELTETITQSIPLSLPQEDHGWVDRDHYSVHPTLPSMGGPWVSWQRPLLSPSHSPFHGRTMGELTETITQSIPLSLPQEDHGWVDRDHYSVHPTLPSIGGPWVSWQRPLLNPSHSPFHGWTMGELTETITQSIPLSLPRVDHGWVDRDHYSIHPTLPSTGGPWVSWQRPLLNPSHSPFHGWTMGELTETITQSIPLSLPRVDHGWVDRDHYSVHPTLPSTGGPWVSWQRPLLSPSHSPFHGWTMGELTETITQSIPLSFPRVDHGWVDRDHYSVHPTLPSMGGPWVSWQRPLLSPSHSPFHGRTMGELTETITQSIPLSLPRVDHGWVDRDHYSVHPTLPSTGGPWVSWQRPLLSPSHSPFHGRTMGELTETITQSIPLSLPRVDHGWVDRDHYSVHPTLPSTGGPWVSWQRPLLSPSHSPFHGRTMGELTETITQSIPLSLPREDHGWVDRDHYSVHPTLPSTGGPWVSWQRPLLSASHSPFHGWTMGELTETITQSIPLSLPREDHGWVDRDHYSVHPTLPSTGGPWVSWQRPLLNPSHSPFHGWTMGELTETITQSIPLSLPRVDHGWVDRDHYSVHPTLPSTGGPWVSWQRPLLSPSHSPFHRRTMGELTETITQSIPLSLPQEDHGWVDRDHYSVHPTLPSMGGPWVSWQRPLLSPSHSPFHGRTMGELTETITQSIPLSLPQEDHGWVDRDHYSVHPTLPSTGGPWVSWQRPLLSPSHSPFHGWTMGELTETITQSIPLSLPRVDHGWVDRDHYSVHPTLPSTGGPWVSWQRPLLSPSHSPFHRRTMGELTETITQSIPLSLPQEDHGWVDRDHYSVHPTLPSMGGPWVSWQRPLLSPSHSPFHGRTMGELTETITQSIPLSLPQEDHGWVDRDHYSVHPTLPSTGGPWVSWQRPLLSPSHSPFHGRTMGELTETITQSIPLSLPRVDHGWVDRDHYSVHPTLPSMGGPWVSWQRPLLSPSHSPFHRRTMGELTETITQSIPLSLPRVDHGWVDRDHYSVHPTLPSTGGPWVSWQRPLLSPSHSPFHRKTMGELTETITQSIPLSLPQVDHGWVDRDHYSIHPTLPSTGGPWVSWQRPLLNPSHSPFTGWTMGELTETITQCIPLSLPQEDHGWVDRDHYSVHPTLPSTGGPWVSWQRPLLSPSHSPFHWWTMGELTETITQSIPLSLPWVDHGWVDRDHYSVHPTLPSTGGPWMSWQRPLLNASHSPFHGRTMGELTETITQSIPLSLPWEDHGWVDRDHYSVHPTLPSTGGPWVSWQRPLLSPSHSPFHGRTMGELTETITQSIPLSLPRVDHGWVDRDHYSVHPTLPSTGGPWVSWQRPLLSPSHSPFHGWTMGELTETITQSIPLSLPREDHGWVDRDHYSVHPTLPSTGGPWVSWQRPLLSPSHSPFHGWTMGELTETITQCIPLSLPWEDHGWVDRDHYSVHPTLPSMGGPWVSWQRPLLSPSHSPFHGRTMGELTETITQSIPLSLPREDHGWVDRDHYSVHPTLPSTGGPWVSWQRPLLSPSHSPFHGRTMGELTETITQSIPLSLPREDHGWVDRDHYSVHPTLPSTGGPWVSWQRPLLSPSHSPFHGWTMGELTETITQSIPLSLPLVDHGWVDRDHYSIHPTLPSTGGPWVSWQRPLLSPSHSPFHWWTIGELTETITQSIPLSLPREDHGWVDRDHYSVHPTLPSTGGPWMSWQRPLLSASHSPFHGWTMGELTETITQSIPLSLPRVDHGWVDRDHYSVHPTLPSTGGPLVSWQRPLLSPSHSPFHGWTMGELTETITQSIPLSLPREDHGWVDRDHYSVHPTLPSTGGPWVSWQRPLLSPSHSPFHGWTMGELTETITQSIPLSLPRVDHGWVDRDHYSVHPTLPSTGGPWVSWQRPLLSPSHSPFHGRTMGELTETITQSIPLSLPQEDHGWVDRDHYSVHPTLPSTGGPWVSWQRPLLSPSHSLPLVDHGWVDRDHYSVHPTLPSTGGPWVSWQRPLLSPSHSPFHGWTMDELTETITQSIPLSLPRVDHGWVDRDHYSVHPTLPSTGGPWVSWQRPLLSPSHSPFHGRTMGELTETITQSIPLSLPQEDHGWVDRDHYSVHPTLPSTGGPWVSWQRPLLSPSHSPFHGRTMGELTETITQSIPLSLPRVDHGWVDRDHYSVHPNLPSTGGPWVSWQRPLLSAFHSPFHGWTMGELTETITQSIPLSLPRVDHGWVDRDHYSVHPTLPSTGGPWVSWQRPLLSPSHSPFHGWTMGELTETITQCIPLSLPREDHGWVDRDHYSVHPNLPSTGGPWVSWQRPLLSPSHSPFHGWTMGELTETITQCIPLSLPRVDHGWVDRDHYSVHPTLPSTGGPWVSWQRPLLSASHSPFHGWTMGELTETITQCIPLSLPRVDHGWVDRDHYSVHSTLPSTGGPWVSWQRPLLSASHSPFHGRTMGELTETITQCIPLSLPREDHGWVDRDHYSVHPTLPSTGGPWVSWQRPLLSPSHSPFHGRTMGELTETITQCIPLSLPRVDHGWVDRDHYSVHPTLPSTGGPWVSWQRPLLSASHSPFHGWTMGELTETITQSIPLSLPREDHGWVDRDHYSVHPTLPSTGGPWVSWQRPLLSASHSPFHGWTMGELTETITQCIPLSLPRVDHGWVDRDHYSVHPTLPSTGGPWVSWQRPLLSPSQSPFHGWTMGELTETITQCIPLSLPRVDHGWVDRDHYSVHPTLPSTGGPWVSWQRPLLSPSHSPFHGWTMGELTETITQSIPLSLPREDHGWVDRDHYSVHPTLPSTGGPWVSWQRPLLSASHSPFHGRTMGELTETITQCIPISLPRVDHGWVDRDHYSVHPNLPSTGGPWVSWQRPLLSASHSPFHGWTMGELTETITQSIPLSLPRVDHGWVDRDHYSVHPTLPSTGGPWVSWQRPLLSPSHSPFHGRTMGELTETITQSIPLSLPREDHGWVDRDHYSVHPTLPSTGGPWVSWQRPLLSPSHSPFHGRTMGELTETITQSIPLSLPRVDHGWVDRDHYSIHPTLPSTGGPWVSWQRPLLSPSHSPFHGWTMGELTETITQSIPLSLPWEDHGWVDRDHYSVHPTLSSTGGPWVSWQRPLLSPSHSPFHGRTMGELTETITQCIPLSLPREDHGWVDRDHYSVHPTLPSTGGPWVSWQRPLLSPSHSPFHGWTMGELTETITQSIPLSLPQEDHGWVDRDHYSVHPTLSSTGGPWVSWQRPLLSPSHSPFHGRTMGELTETITQCIPLSLPRVDHGWVDRDHYSVHPTLPSTGRPWVSWQRPLLSPSHSPFHGWTMGELTETITQSIPLSLPQEDHGWVDRDHYSVHPTLPSTGGPWVSWQRPLLSPSHSPFHGWTMGELTETITQCIPLSLPREDHGWVDRDHYSVHPTLSSTGGPWVSWQRPLLSPSHSPFHGWTMGELTETITQSIPLSLPREDHGWVDRDHPSFPSKGTMTSHSAVATLCSTVSVITEFTTSLAIDVNNVLHTVHPSS